MVWVYFVIKQVVLVPLQLEGGKKDGAGWYETAEVIGLMRFGTWINEIQTPWSLHHQNYGRVIPTTAKPGFFVFY